ncbi:MAG: ABC transporter ATP-binding protein/permease [Chloroflexi bacterium]|nr:ABC transporter ATP-binding protein/permease [Chloroflexota bacterium]MCL5274107.1 ABC transporter ATP-binding protein/permease [Chloroflexota bacterium]
MSVNQPLRDRLAATKIVWQFVSAAPLPVLTQAILRLLNAFRPAVSTVIMAAFVNALIAGQNVLIWAVALALVTLIELLTDMANQPISEWIEATAARRVHKSVLAKIASAPLIRFHDPSFHDSVTRASQDLPVRITRWFESFMTFVNMAAAIAALIVAILALGGGPIVAGVVLANSLLGIVIQRYMTRIDVEQARNATRPRRIAEAWADLLANRKATSEVRLFRAQDWIHRNWFAAYQQCAHLDRAAAASRARLGLIGSVFSVIAYAIVALVSLFVANQAGPAQAAGVFVGLLMTAQAMQGYLNAIVWAIGRLSQDSSLIGDLTDFFSRSTGEETAPRTDRLDSQPVGIELENVHFRYPAAQCDVLRGVTANIAPNEVIALVGPNGAGKSTLSALILNFFRASEGSVAFNGKRDADGPQGSAVLQDFTRYALSVRDNVGFGDLARIEQDSVLQRALTRAGSSLGDDLDTSLGPEFGGRDLSGGEWLRVAIARGVLPESGLLVMDEPTAAIDPVAEVDIVNRLLSHCRDGDGRTTVVVSHRLGVSRFADRIIVMDQGRICEQGSHRELLAAGGLYASMWQAQSSWYSESDTDQR